MEGLKLEARITLGKFSKMSVDKKLDVLYQINLTQQIDSDKHGRMCSGVRDGFGDRLVKLETAKKIEGKRIAGIGGGIGAGLITIYETAKAVYHSMFSGG